MGSRPRQVRLLTSTRPMQKKLTEIMDRALSNGSGVAVKTNDLDGLRRRFYAARANTENPERYKHLRFSPSPIDETELWVIVEPDLEELLNESE